MLLDQVKKLSSIILDTQTFPGDLFNTTRELYSLFSEISGVSIEEHSADSTQVENGLAVSPGVAAFCMIDLARTQKFSLALLEAIKDKVKEVNNRKVEVLYAGCGPYATLLSVIAPFLQSESVEFTLLDIHPESLKAAEHLLDKLGCNSLVKEYTVADASLLELKGNKPDIIVSETMTAGLQYEPQVSIMLNLLSQVGPDTIFIPENVKLNLNGFISENVENDEIPNSEGIDLGCVFNLQPSLINAVREGNVSDTKELEGLSIDINAQYDYFRLSTFIKIYSDYRLEPKESSLTIHRNLKQVFKLGDRVKGTYHISESPELLLESISQTVHEPSH